MVTNLSSLSTQEFDAISAEVAGHAGLNQVLAWASSKPRHEVHPQIVVEVIVQDEFTHDVIVPYRDVVLVYDTT